MRERHVINRNGSLITFKEVSKNIFQFIVIPKPYYWRYGGEMDDLVMVDPEGGPAIYIGSNIGKDDEKLIVTRITSDDTGIKLYIDEF